MCSHSTLRRRYQAAHTHAHEHAHTHTHTALTNIDASLHNFQRHCVNSCHFLSILHVITEEHKTHDPLKTHIFQQVLWQLHSAVSQHALLHDATISLRSSRLQRVGQHVVQDLHLQALWERQANPTQWCTGVISV